MSEGFKLKIDAGINIKEDYYWELYTHDAERDPRYKSLIIDDRPPYRRCERVSFEEIIRNHLNRNDFFDFEYSPKIGDRLFLSFYFESQLLKYHFTYDSVKKIWDIPVADMAADWAPKRVNIYKKKTPFFNKQWTAVGKNGAGAYMKELQMKLKLLEGVLISIVGFQILKLVALKLAQLLAMKK